MSDDVVHGVITFAKRGNDWTLWLKSSNGSASFDCEPGWKNVEGKTGVGESIIFREIDSTTEDTLDEFLALKSTKVTHVNILQQSFMTISFQWLIAPAETEQELVDLIKKLLRWDDVFLEHYRSSEGSHSELLWTGREY